MLSPAQHAKRRAVYLYEKSEERRLRLRREDNAERTDADSAVRT